MEIKKYWVNSEEISIQNQKMTVKSWDTAHKILTFKHKETVYKVQVLKTTPTAIQLYVFNTKQTATISLKAPKKKQPSSPAPDKFATKLRSPIAGRVIKIHVKPGEFVEKNSPLVTIESMKMENEIRAQTAAFVKTIHITQGHLVQTDHLLMTFEEKGERYAKSYQTYVP